MPLIIIISFILLTIFTIISFIFPANIQQYNLITLGLTLLVLIWYTYDTHRIANQTLEVNLRPVILRSGFIKNWDSITFEKIEGNHINGEPISFFVSKNIAKDISGHIIIKNKKYDLLFGSPISEVNDPAAVNGKIDKKYSYTETWGWLNPGNTLFAVFDPTNFEEVSVENEIYVRYEDIEGNEYFTKEDHRFYSVSGRT